MAFRKLPEDIEDDHERVKQFIDDVEHLAKCYDLRSQWEIGYQTFFDPLEFIEKAHIKITFKFST